MKPPITTADPTPALTALGQVVKLLEQQVTAIGILLAGLMIGIYTIIIMLKDEKSATAKDSRWVNVEKVLICAAILAAIGPLAQFATGLGTMVTKLTT